jgi:DNA-binding NarL/FixJ family response regulator
LVAGDSRTGVLIVWVEDGTAVLAEGRSNTAIARALVVSVAAVGKHMGNVLSKLDLPPDEDDHRRVLAILTYLRG